MFGDQPTVRGKLRVQVVIGWGVAGRAAVFQRILCSSTAAECAYRPVSTVEAGWRKGRGKDRSRQGGCGLLR